MMDFGRWMTQQKPAKPEEEPLQVLPEGDCLVDHDVESWHSILQSRGGCTCFLSPPCNACSNPVTEEELNAVGFTYGKDV